MQEKLSTRHLTVLKRNEILIKFLKPKLKDKSLSNIKSEIKSMLNIARHKKGNLEQRLYEINENAQKIRENDANKLYTLLNYLYINDGVESYLMDDEKDIKADTIYIKENDMTECMDKNNQQIHPVTFYLRSDRLESILDKINHQGYFVSEYLSHDSDRNLSQCCIHKKQ